jgi:hypothetical protein
VYDEERNILYWADQSSQGRINVFCTGPSSPTNQPRKDTLPFVIFESPFTSVSTVHYEYKADPMTSFEKDDCMTYTVKKS